MMRSHIRDKLIFSMLILVLVPIAFYFSFTINEMKKLLADNAEQNLERLLQMTEFKYFEARQTTDDRQTIENRLRDFVKGADVYLLTAEDLEFQEKVVTLKLGENRASVPRSQWEHSAVSGGGLIIPVALAHASPTGFSYRPYRLAVRVSPSEWPLVLLRDEEQQGLYQRRVMLEAIQWSGIFIALALLLALVLAQRFTRPIIFLQRWAETIEAGHYNRKLKITRKDELGQLAESLNRMAERIDREVKHLTELKNYNERIIESIFSGVITVDKKGNLRACNHRASVILKLPEELLLTRSSREVFEHYPQLLKVMDATLDRGEKYYRKEIHEVLPDGEKVVIGINSNQLLDGNGNILGATFFFQDLTEITQLAEEVKQNEKMAALGEMAGAVAHELRNPLNPIRGFAQLIQTEEDLQEIREYAGIIITQVADLQHLAEKLLLYTRRGEVEWSVTDVNIMIDELLRLRQQEINDRKLTVTKELSSDLMVLTGPAQLRSIIDNLVRNAISMMTPGGRLGIAARRTPDVLRIEISDTGPGMEPALAAKIFTPFFTTRQQGTGLGLAITKKMIDELQGEIAVSSFPGRGTTFTVKIPLESSDEKSISS